MERIHKLTEEFMLTAGQTVRQTPSIPTVDEMKLRLALEFEELKEKAQAMGLEGSFALICSKSNRDIEAKCHRINGDNPNMMSEHSFYQLADTGIVNLVEVFDAALDQRVVASGTDLAFGFQHIIEAGDTEVHRSNMSKFDRHSTEDAMHTLNKYVEQGQEVHQIIVKNYIVTRRNGDNKILKSHNYSPADLKEIVQIGEFEGK